MTQRHGETDRAGRGLERTTDAWFVWLEDNARPVTLVIVGLLLIGGASAGAYEWSQRRAQESQDAYDRIERRFLEAMGSASEELLPSEPANPDQARAAREEALAAFSELSERTSGVIGYASRLRAAEMEVDLGRLEAALARLTAAEQELPEDHVLRGAALRLRGYVLEELERFAEAASSYEQGARVEDYPAREQLWVSAADNYLRVGDRERARDALSEALALAPVWAPGRQALSERLAGLEDASPIAPAEG